MLMLPRESVTSQRDNRFTMNKLSCHGPKIVFGDMKAKLHTPRPGEEDIMGPYAFGNPAAAEDPLANRSLLTELCYEQGLLIANTFVPQPKESRVTYFDLGAAPFAEMNHKNFAQLNHVLLPPEWLTSFQNIQNDRSLAFASHHFLLTAQLIIEVEKASPRANQCRVDSTALRDEHIAA